MTKRRKYKKRSVIHYKHWVTHFVRTKKGKFKIEYNRPFNHTRLYRRKGIYKIYYEILTRKGNQVNKFKKQGLDKIFNKHGYKGFKKRRKK